ncbi:MAG: hypothetical protein JJT89_13640 [Nitriliruptoraceae bacterium]|nr:hypothetical protein [Nitriliruptoraceae bacterium]
MPDDAPAPTPTAVTDRWFELLATELATGGAPGARAPAGEERAALLDLARIAAHTADRWTAPVSTYLAGLALAQVPPGERGPVLHRLVATLEVEAEEVARAPDTSAPSDAAPSTAADREMRPVPPHAGHA